MYCNNNNIMMMMIITSQIYFISDVFSSVVIVVALTFLCHRNGMCNVSKQPRRRPEKSVVAQHI